ncbi:MAG TPA: DUF4143 domain-containing protein [Solirubrobacterales bacterium]|nr:DUF4143 domain-containing protein [Solirubrobacterales bacterium]
MSLYELGISNGDISLAALLRGEPGEAINPGLELDDLAEAICRGGWPAFRNQLRRAAKRHFVDPSLAVAALQAAPSGLVRDLSFMGLLFESMVIRDLKIYAQAIDGEVEHYQDSSQLEVDAIVRTADSWGAFEVKLGGSKRVEEGAAALARFKARIDTTKSGDPAALAVIAGVGYGYVRKDGIQVIPIGCLGP